jgi:hypothetical protein
MEIHDFLNPYGSCGRLFNKKKRLSKNRRTYERQARQPRFQGKETEVASMPTRRRFLEVLTAASYSSVVAPAFALSPDCPAIPHGGKPFKAQQDTRPIVTRKPVSALSQAEIAQLRKAFAALRALPSSDPRSWIGQTNLHAAYCRQCSGITAQIHGSWNFLPWHRAFLYYHERILGSLVGDIEGFRLPYWEWEQTRTFPQPYIMPNNGANSLWDNQRNVFLLAGQTLPITDASVDRIAFLNGITDFTTFGGTRTIGGAMEIDPHNLMHVDSGRQEPPWTDMGNLASSARDPLFFAHHANVDKIWSRWNAWNPNPEEAAFHNLRWTFYDEHGEAVSISVRDVLAHATQLRYAYPPSSALLSKRRPLTARYPARLRCCAHSGSVLEAENHVREKVTTAARNGESVAIVLDRVAVPHGFSGTFDVIAYRNGRKKHFGNLVVADDGMRMHGNHRTALAFDASDVIADLLHKQAPMGIYALARYGGEPFVLSTQAAQLRVSETTPHRHALEAN